MRYPKIVLLTALLFLACNDKKEENKEEVKPEPKSEVTVKEVMLSQQQFEALGLKMDTLKTRLMRGY